MEDIENIFYIIGVIGAALIGTYKGYRYFKNNKDENSQNQRKA